MTIPLPDKEASICQARGAVAGRMASLAAAGVCCWLVRRRRAGRKASEAAGELEIPEDSIRRWV